MGAAGLAWCSELIRASGDAVDATDDLLRQLPLAASPAAADVTAILRSADIKSESLALPDGSVVPAVYCDTLVDRQRLWDEVVRPLLTGSIALGRLPRTERPGNLYDIAHLVLRGYAVLLPPGAPPAALDVSGLQQRHVDEPTTEHQIIGPKEAFVEKLETDIGLVRNRLRDPRLRLEYHVVGRRSRTRVAMLHVEGVTSPDLVARMREGLGQVAVDHIRTAMDVAELIFARTATPFPMQEQTERPDRVAVSLAEGRLALLVEGSPFALVVPVTFFEFQKDGEGAIQGPVATLFVRTLRLLGVFATVMIPGLYVALLSADVGVLPTSLALVVSTGRASIPYPVLTETLLLMVLVDILAEAIGQAASGVGQTLGVVGSLIVGQMMVEAGLASSLAMIVVATTMLGSFLALKFTLSYSLRIWKYPVILLSAVAGLEGWFTGLMLALVGMAHLKSVGVPYLRPVAPLSTYDVAHYGPVQPSSFRQRRRPSMWNPLQRVRARPGGRR